MAAKLDNKEKFAIKGMLADGKSATDIATELGRNEATIVKYISTELDGIIDTIVKSRVAQAQAEEAAEPEFKAEVSEEIMVQTIHKLKQAGFSRDDARDMVKRVLSKLNFHPDTSTQLYAICVRSINSQDLMVKRAAGGRKGVAVMTKAASERIDEFVKNQPKQGNRKVRECVFKPKDGTMASDE